MFNVVKTTIITFQDNTFASLPREELPRYIALDTIVALISDSAESIVY